MTTQTTEEIKQIQPFDNMISRIPTDGVLLKNENQLTLKVQKYVNLSEEDMNAFYDWMTQIRLSLINQQQDNFSMYSAARSTRSNKMSTMDYYNMLIEPASYEEFVKQATEEPKKEDQQQDQQQVQQQVQQQQKPEEKKKRNL